MVLILILSLSFLQEPKKIPTSKPRDRSESKIRQVEPPPKSTPKPKKKEASPEVDLTRARLNGPTIHDPVFQEEKRGYTLFLKCKEAIEKTWLPSAYHSARAVDLDVRLDMDVQPPKELGSAVPLEVEVDIKGIATPNGMYRLNVEGEVGNMDLIRDASRKMLIYHSGKGFSDQRMPRHPRAGLTNYRSYALRYLNQLKDQVVTRGGFRYVYVGSGTSQGQAIDIIKISKPATKKKKGKKKVHTVPLNRLWTFWQTGEYELWLFQDSYLPAAIFYANEEDHIYANITVAYHDSGLPAAFQLQNNSTGFEGSANIVLDYHEDRTLSRVAFKMRSSEGHDMTFEALLTFKEDVDPRQFQGIPPFDYQKLNPDHLKLLILTPIVGNLLQLQQQGLKLKNFKF